MLFDLNFVGLQFPFPILITQSIGDWGRFSQAASWLPVRLVPTALHYSSEVRWSAEGIGDIFWRVFKPELASLICTNSPRSLVQITLYLY
jgi:hypothetical protein